MLFRSEETPAENVQRREELLQQINTLKFTMENNEKIKREIEVVLRNNLAENKNLQQKLQEFASSVDTVEDIELANKLLDIERLDLFTQNLEIKKEALNLAKDKINKSKQISQMEEELREMKRQLEEKVLFS